MPSYRAGEKVSGGWLLKIGPFSSNNELGVDLAQAVSRSLLLL